MSYNVLNDQSGGSAEDRRNEADRILDMFRETHVLGALAKHERDFIDQVSRGFPISVNQLFWLRDLKTRCLE